MPSRILEQHPVISKRYPTRYCFHIMLQDLFDHSLSSDDFVIVEVGLGFGDFSVYLMESLNEVLDVDFDSYLYSVENWGGRMMKKSMIDVREKVLNRFKKYENNRDYSIKFKCIEEGSLDAVNQFDDDSIHFIYIDANHRYGECLADYRAWWPKVKKGGVMAGHDYAPYRRDGVRRAVKTFFKDELGREKDLQLTADVNPHPSFWIVK